MPKIMSVEEFKLLEEQSNGKTVHTSKKQVEQEFKCKVCNKTEEEMYFDINDPDHVFCADHNKEEHLSFSTEDLKIGLFDRDGHEIIEVLYSGKEETKAGPIEFFNSVTTQDGDGNRVIFCDYGQKELRSLADEGELV